MGWIWAWLLCVLFLLPMEVREVDLTVYACEIGDLAYWGDGGGYCGTTYSGVQVGPGVAACSWGMELGTVFWIEGDPTGRVYVCLDRGAQVGFRGPQVDIWFPTVQEGMEWLAVVGTRQRILIWR